jgi:hypothetical protein
MQDALFFFGDRVELVAANGSTIATGIVSGSYGGVRVQWDGRFKGFSPSNPAPAGCKLIHAQPEPTDDEADQALESYLACDEVSEPIN